MRTIAKLTAFCAVLLFTAVSLAGPTLVVTKSGYYLMTQDANGVPVTEKVTSVVVLGDPGTPVPPDEPPDVTTDPISTQVKAWAAEINDPQSAQALTMVYREIAKKAPGQPREKVMQALRETSDAVLAKTGGVETWKPWRAKVSGLIDAQEAAGTVDYAKLCNSIADGLESSAPAAALDPELLRFIIETILSLILRFFGGGGGTGV